MSKADMATILFVDDEQSVLNALRRVFLDAELNCRFASSAEEALLIIQRESICVVVSDNSMPGMKGVDLLSHLKLTSPDTGTFLGSNRRLCSEKTGM